MTGAPRKGVREPVLLFDFGGTLDADGIAWKDRFARLWRQEAGEVDARDFDRAFYDADDALVGSLPPASTLGQTARGLADGLAARLRPADPGAAGRIASRFCSDAAAHLAASASLLESLSDRYRLAVVSNFYGNLQAVCEEAGLSSHLAAAIDSAAVGFQKPDARIFRAALAALDAAPSDAVFIGDSLARDMAGAREIGMRHVWIAGSHVPEPEPCCAQDRVIRRVLDLPDALA